VAGLLSDDTVSVTCTLEADGRATATALTRTARARTAIFGVVLAAGGGLGLRPDPHVGHGQWALTGRLGGVAAGNAVLAEITGDALADPLDIWDDPTDPSAIVGRVLARQQILEGYPAGLDAAQARYLSQAGPRADGVHRRDLREATTFTIDAPHSRDLDDALSVYPADPDGGLRVCVHIADVSAHLPAGSPLDLEAARSGTSVYLPDWTRPMLPAELSEDALSLLPGLDRDVLTVEMRLDADGRVTSADVYAAVIRSTMRLSYEQAGQVLAGGAPAGVPPAVLDALRWLRTAGARLGVQRQRRGGVEAGRVEPELAVRVVAGAVVTAPATASNPANLLIERLMVAANESVATWLVDRGLPAMFRVHPAPAPEAAAALEAFCASAGYHPGFGGELTPLGLAALAAQLEGCADDTSAAVWDVLLGFLGRASYTPTPGGHFGLASPAYLHFTSPIRRYADVVVHRVVRAFLAGGRGPAAFPPVAGLATLADHLNEVGATAAKAESQTRKTLWLVALSAQQAANPKLVLPGRVTGLNVKGAFVALDGSHVSGFLPLADLVGRGWSLAEGALALTCPSGAVLRFGDPLVVRLAAINIEAGSLELAQASTQSGHQAATPAWARKS